MEEITLDDVNKFLEEFKVKARIFGIIFRSDREKNQMRSLLDLGINSVLREKIIFSLEGTDYSEGPIIDTLNHGDGLWVFGKHHSGTELYIKIELLGGKTFCISFHVAERPMSYPFKKNEL